MDQDAEIRPLFGQLRRHAGTPAFVIIIKGITESRFPGIECYQQMRRLFSLEDAFQYIIEGVERVRMQSVLVAEPIQIRQSEKGSESHTAAIHQ
ncbi:hypothetical protein SDC9_56820 [bioreactor metagenome]|uniref:Uncharacterized protein n=1 Tax=bioreactor metagenome TaxID=1076179 RepID=A0A644X3V3_9ZZZZ